MHDDVANDSHSNQVFNAQKKNTVVERTLKAASDIQERATQASNTDPVQGTAGMVVAVANSFTTLKDEEES